MAHLATSTVFFKTTPVCATSSLWSIKAACSSYNPADSRSISSFQSDSEIAFNNYLSQTLFSYQVFMWFATSSPFSFKSLDVTFASSSLKF
jgi:hypothetical protein